ncbi:Hint domain-containing protein [Acidocella sp.]|uniref:Hint domain-containing protein n=1 Tax=Acidocella sp. TaxID=50710 RepID=UPI003D00FDDA
MSGSTISASSTLALQLGSVVQSPLAILAGAGVTLAGTVSSSAPSLTSALYGASGESWAVVNDGTLMAELTLASGGVAGFGAYLAGFGDVTNATAGLIEGGEAGLVLLAGGDASNQGTILGGVGGGTGLGRVGVQFTGAGSLENAGLILGGAYGVSLGAAGLVQNGGRIGGAAAGAVLASTGSLVNQASGALYGGVSGVVLRAGGSLVNAGNIAATLAGAGHEGLVLGSGASAETSGTIDGFDGVWGTESAATLVNHGLIESAGTLGLFFPSAGYSFVSGAAVELTNGIVDNDGLIQGNDVPDNPLMQAGSAGSGVILGAGLLTNAGTIAGGGGFATHGGVGVAGGPGLSASNDGLIAGGAGTYGGTALLLSGGSLLNTGSILGGGGAISGGNGVVLNNGATLVNEGGIQGGAGTQYLWGTGLGAGVALYGGVLENDGLITGGGRQLMALWMGGGQAVNAGTLSGRAAVAMQGGTLENDGLITGTEVAVDLAGGHFTNAGTLAGSYALYMPASGAVLTVAPGALFQGKVADHGGGATLLLTGAGSLDMGASFSGFSDISLAGSGWVLAGGLAQLAGGETITGLADGDALLLEGFTATSESYVSGVGLVLEQGLAEATLAIAGGPASAAFTVSAVAQGTEIVICYRRGTLIQTLDGERDVAALRIGDRLPTRFGGVRQVSWIGRQSFGAAQVRGNRERIPVCIHPGALGRGLPHRPLFVSPGHSMLLDGVLVLARALVNGVTITQDYDGQPVDYFLPEFAAHDCVLAEGAWSESFADGPGLRAQFHNRAAFQALYPGHEEPAGLSLCAPRPLRGVGLEQALRPVVARAGRRVRPGGLQGCLDSADGRHVRGWAQDTDWPELPQELAFYAGGQLLGTALACQYREDLALSRIGTGHAAFSFTAPRRFSPAALRIRRVADGAALHIPVIRAA